MLKAKLDCNDLSLNRSKATNCIVVLFAYPGVENE